MTRNTDRWPELVNLEGSIDRPIAAAQWRVPPGIDLQAGRLVWRAHAVQPAIYANPGPGMLEAFVGLADAPDRRLLDYARRWGVLGLCKHGLPMSHNPRPEPVRSGPITWCKPLGWPGEEFREPLDAWREHSIRVRGLLNAAARLQEGQLARTEDWQALFGQTLKGERVPWWTRVVEADRSVVAHTLAYWLWISRVGLHPVWGSGGFLVQFSVSGLFGALVAQMLLAVGPYGRTGNMFRMWLAIQPEKGTQPVAASLLRNMSRAEGPAARCSQGPSPSCANSGEWMT